MILDQHYLACLSHASYLIGDEQSGTAVVVDPQRDVEVYLRAAAEKDLFVRHVILTHFHADFLAGHLELAQRTGATIHLGPQASAEYPHQKFGEGDALELGPRVVLKALETPGHTPEGISVVVYDRQAGQDPQAVLTGDTLFIGDVGRPDLMASVGVTEEELATQLFHSLRDKLLTLPDATLVYPAHGAGSLCGKALSSDTVSTIGDQRRDNPNLQPMEVDEFVRRVSTGQPNAPAYFAFAAQRNREQRPVLHETVPQGLRPLDLGQALRECNKGAVLLDVRAGEDYAALHLEGSLNVGLGGRFATWAGTMVPVGSPVVVIADPEQEHEAVTRLGRIGYDQVLGYVEGGPAAFVERPELCRTTERIDAGELQRRLAREPELVVLDVRAPNEHTDGHIAGSLNIPLQQLAKRLDEIPRERPLVVHCRTDYRSSAALGLIEGHGLQATQLEGGWLAWHEASAASAS